MRLIYIVLWPFFWQYLATIEQRVQFFGSGGLIWERGERYARYGGRIVLLLVGLIILQASMGSSSLLFTITLALLILYISVGLKLRDIVRKPR